MTQSAGRGPTVPVSSCQASVCHPHFVPLSFGTGALGSAAEAVLGKLVTGEVSVSRWTEMGLSRSNNEAYDDTVQVMQRHGIDPDSGSPGHTLEFKDVDTNPAQTLR